MQNVVKILWFIILVFAATGCVAENSEFTAEELSNVSETIDYQGQTLRLETEAWVNLMPGFSGSGPKLIAVVRVVSDDSAKDIDDLEIKRVWIVVNERVTKLEIADEEIEKIKNSEIKERATYEVESLGFDTLPAKADFGVELIDKDGKSYLLVNKDVEVTTAH